MKLMRNTLLAAALIGVNALVFTAPAQAADKVCKLAIGGNDLMQYDKKELKVAKDCTSVEVTLTHTGKLPAASMGHNWTLTKTADAAGVANDGLSAGLPANYIKAGDKRVIAHTKVVGGGESATVTFPTSALTAGGDYTFECTFPGHSALMKGKFTFG
ncbi:MAG TPA: azurin [Steroidobacteraceae bacterium]|nr:azurin [Steroidobacteraceae bacterium]